MIYNESYLQKYGGGILPFRNLATRSCLTVNLWNMPPRVDISSLFSVIDRRYGHTTPTMATGSRVSVVPLSVLCSLRMAVPFSWIPLLHKKMGKLANFCQFSRFARLQVIFFSLIPSYGPFCGDSILLIYNFCYIVYSMRTVFIIVNRFFWNALFLCHNRFACFFSHFIYTIDN